MSGIELEGKISDGYLRIRPLSVRVLSSRESLIVDIWPFQFFRAFLVPLFLFPLYYTNTMDRIGRWNAIAQRSAEMPG